MQAAQHASQPWIVCFGDSITAGYGLAIDDAYPAALESLLHKHGYDYRVDNQGVNGATTKDALDTVPKVIRRHPEVAVVEFGANDALRGLTLKETEDNLDAVLNLLQSAHIQVVLAEMTLTPDYGKDYIARFQKIFEDQAAKHHAALIPALYRDLDHHAGMVQSDGVHPTVDGSIAIARTVAEVLEPMLKKTQKTK